MFAASYVTYSWELYEEYFVIDNCAYTYFVIPVNHSNIAGSTGGQYLAATGEALKSEISFPFETDSHGIGTNLSTDTM